MSHPGRGDAQGQGQGRGQERGRGRGGGRGGRGGGRGSPDTRGRGAQGDYTSRGGRGGPRQQAESQGGSESGRSGGGQQERGGGGGRGGYQERGGRGGRGQGQGQGQQGQGQGQYYQGGGRGQGYQGSGGGQGYQGGGHGYQGSGGQGYQGGGGQGYQGGGQGYQGGGGGQGYQGGGGQGYQGGGGQGYRGGGGGGQGYQGGGGRGGYGGGGQQFQGRGGPAREQGGVFGGDAPVDARFTDGSQDALVRSLTGVRVRDADRPPRPDFGAHGTQITLRTNFFPVRLPPGPFFEYDVAITPPVTVRRVKRRIWQLAEATPAWAAAGMTNRVVHDHGAKMFAIQRLPEPLAITVLFTEENEDEEMREQLAALALQQQQPQPGKAKPRRKPKPTKKNEFTLTIRYIQQLETESLLSFLQGKLQYKGYDIMPVIAVMNMILVSHPARSSSQSVMVGRNKFFHFNPADPPANLGGGLEAWRGFYSSVRPSHLQLMVNVNVCTTAFYKPGNLAERYMEIERDCKSVRAAVFLKGVRVKATHLGYMKTIKSVSNHTAVTFRFKQDGEDSEEISVADYFRTRYKITLLYPALPLVDLGGNKKNLLPMEVCEILEKQPFRGKLYDEHTAAMIKVACRPPNVNASAIVQRGLNELGFAQTAPPLQSFGMSIGADMAVVPGRLLEPPNIQYKAGTPRIDERAGWNLRNIVFAEGARVDSWAVLSILDRGKADFDPNDNAHLMHIVRGLAKMCGTCGLTMPAQEPYIVHVALPQRDPADPIRQNAIWTIEKTIPEELKSGPRKPSMFLIILPSKDRNIYSGVKYLFDTKLDIATVCARAEMIKKEKGQLQFFANLALKINVKMGGLNHRLNDQNIRMLRDSPTMLVGMDVTHPGYGTVKGTPSIAAVVGNIDGSFGQFPASLRIQESKKEMVSHLADMLGERLAAFQRRCRILPERIIVYRDGVSEGQFGAVLAEEMPQMRQAFRKFDTTTPYRPKLTIVVCGKRHHTRFYPTKSEHADKDGNPRPGTVVDRGVTAIYDFDFFLQAHGGIQGTTRPTHYYVLHDEIGFKADQLQTLTNNVSYMFARATKAVSLVSPAYYADLACERGRCYLHSLLSGITKTGSTSSADVDEDAVLRAVVKEAQDLWGSGVGPSLRETMFYL